MDRRKGLNRLGFRRIAFGDWAGRYNARDRTEHSEEAGSIPNAPNKKCWGWIEWQEAWDLLHEEN